MLFLIPSNLNEQDEIFEKRPVVIVGDDPEKFKKDISICKKF